MSMTLSDFLWIPVPRDLVEAFMSFIKDSKRLEKDIEDCRNFCKNFQKSMKASRRL